jgi:hypothetical protein
MEPDTAGIPGCIFLCVRQAEQALIRVALFQQDVPQHFFIPCEYSGCELFVDVDGGFEAL